MKHRSPLVTLATVLVAFVIMFTVNMLSGPPGRSPAGTADAPVGSASGSASSGSPQPTEIAVLRHNREEQDRTLRAGWPLSSTRVHDHNRMDCA